ncbi:hypothetical protein BJ165DRAFT_1534431 [Panaeolus papilionaceus]|nr:hypothetical protein BJ165DRAFT_1534431 [Panaeolus papilionaceus]
MPELRVHIASFGFKASVLFDGDEELSLTCCKKSESNVDVGAGYDADSESDCGCGENQLAHYETDGTVCTDLPERCRRHVDGPIGGVESERPSSDRSTSDVLGHVESDTEAETIEHNSMSVGIASEQGMAPPANQLQQAAVERVKKRPPLQKRVTRWNRKVEAARKSSNKRKKGTCRGSGSLGEGDYQVKLNVLGNSHIINIKVAMGR